MRDCREAGATQVYVDDYSIWELCSADWRHVFGGDSPPVCAGAPAPPLRDGSILPGAVRGAPRLQLSLPREPEPFQSFLSQDPL